MSKLEQKTKKEAKPKKDPSEHQWLRRPLAFMVRLTADERAELKRLARCANVTISEYLRVKAFDTPWHYVGGRDPGPSHMGKNGEIASKNGDHAKV